MLATLAAAAAEIFRGEHSTLSVLLLGVVAAAAVWIMRERRRKVIEEGV